MFKHTILASLTLVFSLAYPAEAAQPSNESIQELLTVTESKKLLDGMTAGFDNIMNNAMQQALKGKTISPEQDAIITKMKAKLVILMKEEMSWDKLEPISVEVYKESFSQEEIDGMLSFYKSTTGQAVIKKMPVVMQKSMALMQTSMSTLFPKVQKIQEETLAELRVSK